MMPSDLTFYPFVWVFLILLCLLLCRLWRGVKTVPMTLKPPRAKREPKPFVGLTRKSDCPACAQEAALCPPAASAPNAPPPRMTFTRGRHRYVDHRAVLPAGYLCVSRLGGLGQYPRQWSSQWPLLAATRVSGLPRLVLGNRGHAVAWQAGGTGQAGMGHCSTG